MIPKNKMLKLTIKGFLQELFEKGLVSDVSELEPLLSDFIEAHISTVLPFYLAEKLFGFPKKNKSGEFWAFKDILKRLDIKPLRIGKGQYLTQDMILRITDWLRNPLDYIKGKKDD